MQTSQGYDQGIRGGKIQIQTQGQDELRWMSEIWTETKGTAKENNERSEPENTGKFGSSGKWLSQPKVRQYIPLS